MVWLVPVALISTEVIPSTGNSAKYTNKEKMSDFIMAFDLSEDATFNDILHSFSFKHFFEFF